MYHIQEIQIEPSVFETKFACDLNKCKGACCTFPGGRGAPLHDEEVELIEKHYSAIKDFLPELHRNTIEQHGLVDGESGFYATQCVDGKACVFVYYENGIALCAFEKAFNEKKIDWQKPLSCHLFPLRINYYDKKLYYEYFHECEPALERGKKEHIDVFTFVEQPLTRAFGDKWVSQTKEILHKKL